MFSTLVSRRNEIDDAAAFAPRDAAVRQTVEAMAARRDAELVRSDLHPLLWLTAYLDACAEHGGQAPPDAAAFLPWNLSEARRREFAHRPSPDT